MRKYCCILNVCLFLAAHSTLLFAVNPEIEKNMSETVQNGKQPSVYIPTFHQEVSHFFTTNDNLPSNEVHSIAAYQDGTLFAGTSQGMALYRQDKTWRTIRDFPNTKIRTMTLDNKVLYAATDSMIWVSISSDKFSIPLPTGLEVHNIAIVQDTLYLATTEGLYYVDDRKLKRDDQLFHLLGMRAKVNDIAVHSGETIAVAAESGLFIKKQFQPWEAVFPNDDQGRSWALRSVQAVGYQPNGSLWFASPQGAGVLNPIGKWTLFEGKDGLPYNDFTSISASADHVWFGTTKGAIRVDINKDQTFDWHYRQGLRWLPNDHIHSIAESDAGAWFATQNGIGFIENKEMTLAQKAEYYEEEVEKYIKRTEYGYLSEVSLHTPEDKSKIIYHDSDNDGLWTSMYGAGECFAFAATHTPEAKQRAKDAFEALRFLRTVTIGSETEMQPGYVARTIVPTTEPDPNQRSSYIPEGQKRKQKDDGLWKVITPRFPLSKDGKYWFKIDTSSDELDGHYFFNGLYYDLAAESEEEKQRVREHVQAMTDHLIRNRFVMIDHDGKPTRWAIFNPESINHDPVWFPERGLNSLSMLSYLATTEHITGDSKYGEIAKQLQEKHAYDQNAMVAKLQYGPGSGNQSDDEMAIMSFYNLIKYSKDDDLRYHIRYSFFNYWAIEFPEMNPFFNFAFAASNLDQTYTDPWGTYSITPWDGWLEDSLATLKGFSLDRRNWGHLNSHRLDIVPLPRQAIANYPNELPGRLRAHRINGKVIPVENRFFNHYNTDPWTMNYGGSGHGLASGTVYLLPYYMGIYYGFIKE